jgi:hypothetical protein
MISAVGSAMAPSVLEESMENGSTRLTQLQ